MAMKRNLWATGLGFLGFAFVLASGWVLWNVKEATAPAPLLGTRPPDGEYVSLMLPCKCGGVVVYVPGSCVCFDAENYPDLDAALKAVYGWAQKNSGGKKHDKPVGRYETLTLECGCSIAVFAPKSSGCLSKKYPDFEKLLEDVYRLATKHKEK